MSDNQCFCRSGEAVERLETFGWNQFFEPHFRSFEIDECCPARIASDYGQAYRLYTEHGEMRGEVSGRLRQQADARDELPAVGDWVIIKPILGESKAVIHEVLPRRSRFSRKAAGTSARQQVVAANIDTVFVVTSLNNDFNLRRLERYIAAVWDSGASPVVILSKSDLCGDSEAKIKEVEQVAFGVPAHAISAVSGEGLELIDEYFVAGKTIAMIGSSGVGKSTLINKVIGSDARRVLEIRQSDDRGKHATTTRDLILLPQGGLIIDTPGMRELQLWDGGEGLLEAFDDVERLAAACYFGNCSHRAEPGCAVREAIEKGLLDESRLESFEKLQKEQEFFEMRRDLGAKRAEKKRWKKVIEMQRKKVNRKGGY